MVPLLADKVHGVAPNEVLDRTTFETSNDEPFTVSEKVSVKVSASMSKPNCTSTGGMLSRVNIATFKGTAAEMALTELLYMSRRKKLVIAMNVLVLDVARLGSDLITFRSAVLNAITNDVVE